MQDLVEIFVEDFLQTPRRGFRFVKFESAAELHYLIELWESRHGEGSYWSSWKLFEMETNPHKFVLATHESGNMTSFSTGYLVGKDEPVCRVSTRVFNSVPVPVDGLI